MNRYVRQMAVQAVGPTGQARLAAAHVLVIGAGGLGCPVLQYLSGAGVGQITLLDADHVEETNLHRQPLYRMTDLGRPKVQAARDHVLAANPGLSFDARQEVLHPANAPELVAAADLIIDAADSFAVSYILSDACRAVCKPLISASALEQSGYVGAFCGSAPSLRAVFPDPPESAATCATAGVLGPVVGAIGALQAQMALGVLLQNDPSPMGRMLTLDLATLQIGGFGFLGSPEPQFEVPYLARNMLDAQDRVIELRGMDEAQTAITPDAVRISADQLDSLSDTPGQRTVLCCSTGLRAWRAAIKLASLGHKELALLAASASA